MPFTQGFLLSGCNESTIQATDYDLTNTRISYTITPDADFEIENLPMQDKTVPAVIKSKKLLKFTEDKEYTITATDGGDPSRSSTATLSIKVKVDDYTPSTSFEKAYYIIEYDNETPSIIPTNIPITDGVKVEVELQGTSHYNSLRTILTISHLFRSE